MRPPRIFCKPDARVQKKGTKPPRLRLVFMEEPLTEAEASAIIEMALSDHVAFAMIEEQFGLAEKEVKALMRARLKPGSYRAWRKRVRTFSDRRERYK